MATNKVKMFVGLPPDRVQRDMEDEINGWLTKEASRATILGMSTAHGVQANEIVVTIWYIDTLFSN